jgi:hypothetical protein
VTKSTVYPELELEDEVALELEDEVERLQSTNSQKVSSALHNL